MNEWKAGTAGELAQLRCGDEQIQATTVNGHRNVWRGWAIPQAPLE